MKFTAQQQSLYHALTLCLPLVDKRVVDKTVSCFKIEKKTDRLIVISATNIKAGIQVECEVEEVQGESISVPAVKFFEIIRELQKSLVHVEFHSDMKLHIRSEQFKSQILCADTGMFPKFPNDLEGHFVEFSTEQLKNLIDHSVFAIHPEANTEVTSGVFFEMDYRNLVSMTAMESRRLSHYKSELFSVPYTFPSIVIHKKNVLECRRTLDILPDTAQISITEDFLFIRTHEVFFFLATFKGQYPNYTKLFEQESNEFFSVERQQLLSALKRISLIGDHESQNITLQFKEDSLTVSLFNPEFGQASESIRILERIGEFETISLRTVNLQEYLQVAKEDVIHFYSSKQGGPVLVKDGKRDNFKYILMPLRQVNPVEN